MVGASECGLSVIESLLIHPKLYFTALTLLAPGYISVSGVVCNYTSSMMSRLGLEARVEVLDAEMVGLDREDKLVDLSDGTSLPYGYLVIATGLQVCVLHVAGLYLVCQTFVDCKQGFFQDLGLAGDLAVGSRIWRISGPGSLQNYTTLEIFAEKTIF